MVRPITITTIVAIFFIFSFLTIESSPLDVEEIKCENNADCAKYFNNSWCHSGHMCILKICRRIPGVPCDHTQKCIEERKECLNKSCIIDKDCDDGIYCNGHETCTSHIDEPLKKICTPGKDGCEGGICSEVYKKCTWPMKMQHKHPIDNSNDIYITTKKPIDMKFKRKNLFKKSNHKNKKKDTKTIKYSNIDNLKIRDDDDDDGDDTDNNEFGIKHLENFSLPITTDVEPFLDMNNGTTQIIVAVIIGCTVIFSVSACIFVTLSRPMYTRIEENNV